MLTNRQNWPQRPGSMGVSAQQARLHPLSIARMLWKHKLQILLVWIALSAVTVGIVYRIPAVYKAEAVILVDSQKIPDEYVMPTVNTALDDRLLTLRRQLLAYDSLQAIIDRWGLYREQRKSLSPEEILELMSKDTEVELEKGWTRDRPGAFQITYGGTDPKLAAEVANDIATRFINKNIKSREDASQTSMKQQQAEKFTLLQAARVPEVPFKPIRPLWISVGCVAALLISLVIAAARELRAGTLLGEWELPAEAAVLGRVPWISLEEATFEPGPGPGSRSWVQRNWRHALVLSVVVTLVFGIAAVVFQKLNF